MSPYQQMEDYEKTFFDWRNAALRFECCDCGLVHDFVFRPNGAKSYVIFKQNNRSTGQIRRYKYANTLKEAEDARSSE